MIEGHGDDLYKYPGIKMNFSSNIYNGTDLSALQAFLCSRMEVMRSYPEPSAASLERMIASDCGISPDEVLVTSGAVDAIYLIAQCSVSMSVRMVTCAGSATPIILQAMCCPSTRSWRWPISTGCSSWISLMRTTRWPACWRRPMP